MTRSRCFVVIVATATLTLSSCVRTADAYFANPCSVDLEITTYRAPEPLESEEIKSATLQAESVTKVEDAFDSEVGWSVSIEGTDQFLEIDKDTWVHNTVVIPAEVCEEV